MPKQAAKPQETETVDKQEQPVKRGRGQPRKFQTAEQLQRLVDEYFEQNKTEYREIVNPKNGTMLKVKAPAYYTALLLYIGTTYGSIEPYEKGEYDTPTDNYSEVLTRARMHCEVEMYGGAATGQYNERMVSGAMMRHHNWATKQETTVNNTLAILPGTPEQMQALMASIPQRLQQAQAALKEVEAESVEVVDTHKSD